MLNGDLSQYGLIEVRELVIGKLGPLIVPYSRRPSGMPWPYNMGPGY